MAKIVGVHTAGQPIGTIMHVAYDGSLPGGTVGCDGSAVLRAGTYADLFGKVGTTFGIGDGSTTFNLPPGGMFLRNKDQGTSNDPDSASRTAYVAGTFTITGTVTNTSNIVTSVSASDMANVAIGMSITGTNIPATTYVTAKLTATSFQISNSATPGSGTETLTLSKSAMANHVGSFQTHQTESHAHALTIFTDNATQGAVARGTNGGGGAQGNEGTTAFGAGTQTHPKNMSVNFAIVYK